MTTTTVSSVLKAYGAQNSPFLHRSPLPEAKTLKKSKQEIKSSKEFFELLKKELSKDS